MHGWRIASKQRLAYLVDQELPLPLGRTLAMPPLRMLDGLAAIVPEELERG